MYDQIVLVEDNSRRSSRRRGPGSSGANDIVVSVHCITGAETQALKRHRYRPGQLKAESRTQLALQLLDRLDLGPKPLVVAGRDYGASAAFQEGVSGLGLDFAVEVSHETTMRLPDGEALAVSELLARGSNETDWQRFQVAHPTSGKSLDFSGTVLATVRLPGGSSGPLFIAQTGAIQALRRGTILGVSTRPGAIEELVGAVGWARWIRAVELKRERNSRGQNPAVFSSSLTARSNITLARQQDLKTETAVEPKLRGRLATSSPVLNVVELFAGAGGMGLGFLLSSRPGRRYRVAFSGEIHPTYAQTLRLNHLAHAAIVGMPPEDFATAEVQSLDLMAVESMRRAEAAALQAGGVHVLIGGPPCQGFSNANRNSWHSSNPNNQLVEVYLRYVERLKPPIFLMENVQGILWTSTKAKGSRLSVAERILKRMRKAGYLVFPKLLDAVWYGVPQYRTRFFVLGIHEDLGYQSADFGDWGPFPQPTHGAGLRPLVTVRDAIGDLPPIENAQREDFLPYTASSNGASNGFLEFVRKGAPKSTISDHICSRHADYVIDRYRAIPPGGNWRDITDKLTNYADPERTHSNIYRRLPPDEPSITIGHYRKSMLIHPEQHRGLSLREAARLQSFPDWFRFCGSHDEEKAFGPSGLAHKQQQLANAVCPLLTRAIADFILQL